MSRRALGVRICGVSLWLGSTLLVGTFRASLGVTDPLTIQTIAHGLGILSALGVYFIVRTPPGEGG